MNITSSMWLNGSPTFSTKVWQLWSKIISKLIWPLRSSLKTTRCCLISKSIVPPSERLFKIALTTQRVKGRLVCSRHFASAMESRLPLTRMMCANSCLTRKSSSICSSKLSHLVTNTSQSSAMTKNCWNTTRVDHWRLRSNRCSRTLQRWAIWDCIATLRVWSIWLVWWALVETIEV